MKRDALYQLFFVLCLTLALGACRFSSSSDPPPGYLIVGIESNPLQLDPRYSTDANSVRIGSLIYDSLLHFDGNSQLQPELAENWQRIDPRTYVFDLRRNIRFHNGAPLTAADIKFTYESILQAEHRSPKRALLKQLQAIEQLGSHRVRFRLKAPHAPFPEHFTIGIVPAGSPENTGSRAGPPPGSGPFVLASLQSGETVTLKANPSYWEGKPSLAGLVFKVVPDAMVRVLEFKKGSIDFMQNDLEPDILPWIERNTDADIEALQGTTFQYIGINLTHPVLRHKKVRQALALAIDRRSIVRHLLKDLGAPATGLLSPLNWAYEDAVHKWPYNPEHAKQLLDGAGFLDPDGDGPRSRFKLSFKSTNLDLRRRIAEALKEQLQHVGVELEIRTYEWGTFFGDIKKGNFHLYSLAWVGIQDPDIYYQIFHSASVPPNGDNRGHYSNTLVDQLLEKGRKAMDTAERKRIYGEVQRILAEDLPYIPLWWWKNVVVKTPSLQGFVPYPDGDFTSFKKVAFRSPIPAQ
ncbi:MAG TPA: ABC transporter substrate-binding protein [Candidatus Binatia bacterium]|nr:ABC transporter substrate-binding protein [Candidatus Binatia bacterium]